MVDDSDDQRLRSRRKRRRNSSSDSSLLEPVVTPKKTGRSPGERNRWSQIRREESSSPPDREKRKAVTLIVDSSTGPSIPQETFEKRARHRTREDLYDPKRKRKRADKNDEEEKPMTKRTKKGDGKKAAKRAGEDLMNNFTSNRIGQDRLTVSHNYSPCRTRCSNAKASRCVRLMDLVFLRMAAHPPPLKDVDVSSPYV